MEEAHEKKIQRISAADIEKYVYCPLSWKLSYSEMDVENQNQKIGKKEHRKIEKKIKKVRLLENRGLQFQTLVLAGGLLSTLLSILGAIIYSPLHNFIVSRITLIVGLIWLGVSVFLLYISAFFPRQNTAPKMLLLTGILAGMLFLVSSLTYAFQESYFGLILEPIALVWLMFTAIVFFLSEIYFTKAENIKIDLRLKDKKLVPTQIHSPLMTKNKMLTGTPDLLIKDGDFLIPVEIKTGRVPRGPHFSHIMQLIAYCYIIEDVYGIAPPYGLLRYQNTDFEIEYTPEMKKMLETKIEEMNAVLAGQIVPHRNHTRPGKCRACARRNICPEKLV